MAVWGARPRPPRPHACALKRLPDALPFVMRPCVAADTSYTVMATPMTGGGSPVVVTVLVSGPPNTVRSPAVHACGGVKPSRWIGGCVLALLNSNVRASSAACGFVSHRVSGPYFHTILVPGLCKQFDRQQHILYITDNHLCQSLGRSAVMRWHAACPS